MEGGVIGDVEKSREDEAGMGLEAGLFSVVAAARVLGSQGDFFLLGCMSGLVLLAILVDNWPRVKSNCGFFIRSRGRWGKCG